MEDHRGVTLMQTAYKVYATVLTERLREELEDRGICHRAKRVLEEGLKQLIKYMC